MPRGVDDGVMLAVAPVVTLERAAGRSTLGDEGEAAEGLDGKGGEDGDGLSKGVSLSSPSGVDAAESAMAEASDCPGEIWQPATAGSRAAGRDAEGRGGDSNRQGSGLQSGDDASTGERRAI